MAKRIYTEIRIHHKTTDEKEQFEKQLDERVKAAGFSSRAEYMRVIVLKSNILVEEDFKMKEKKMVIWEMSDREHDNYFFEADQIEQVVDFTNTTVYKLSGIPIGNIDTLNEALKNVVERPADEYELEDFLKEQGYSDFEICMLPDLVDYDETNPYVCYDCSYEFEFFNILDCETIEIYRWWDGSNWKTVFCPDYGETEVIIDEDSENCLDEWDGSNWWTGSKFCHQYVYDILEVDGEKPEEPTFLVVYTCQYQDSHPSAEIMTEDELREHLEELGRDIAKYIPAK